ncbi:MAG: glycine cleavage system aminomethyltransferase T/glycine [Gammaproteobacteria bacterium]|jgi:glycine cleavage system aminomethyltransferase T/glycine/D-amino acid oxidase-like deaminating enzyme
MSKEDLIIVIGGGAIGLSIAYHLAKLGLKNITVLERHQLTSGTSWHAAGIVGPLRVSQNLTTLACYAIDLFARIESETGQATGYQQTGGLWLAQNESRLIELKRIKAMGDRNNLNTEMLPPGEISRRFPLLNVEDLSGGMWVDQDGQVNPVDLCMAYAKAARQLGVDIRENCRVDRLQKNGGMIDSVVLEDGETIGCHKLILAAGAWTRQLAATIDVGIATVSCQHMYVVTDQIDDLPAPCPIIRDLDAGVYIKGDAGKLVIGTFEKNPKLWVPKNHDSEFLMFDEDWDHIEPMIEAGIHRIPILYDHGISHFMNGPESFTPDTRQLMGECASCQNLFVATGFNSIGIMSSAGVGKVMAEWVRDNHPPIDLWEVDVNRLDLRDNNDAAFLKERLPESVFNQFDVHWPNKQYQSGRNRKQSIWHDQLAECGAFFGAPTGWERPLWFAQSDAESKQEYSYHEQSWWPMAEREALHCRDHVSLFDLSPFTKIDIKGLDCCDYLERLCCSRVDIEPGRAVYTLMLNDKGGIESEITVSRFDNNQFRLISGAATRFKDLFWLRKNKLPEEDVEIIDVTDDFAVLGIMGPKSRQLLQSISSNDFGEIDFRFGDVKTIKIDATEIVATRLSFVGELGWELTIPNVNGVDILKRIQSVSESLNLGYAGHMALDSCRLENGFLHWGHDMGCEETPFEVGLGFLVNFEDKINFIGRRALDSVPGSNVSKRLKLCEVLSQRQLILHDEPVYQAGQLVGHCTSGGIGFRTDTVLCFVMFYRWDRNLISDTQIEIAGQSFPLIVLSTPLQRNRNR